MAIQEVNAVTRVKNDSGEYIIYPATKAENAAYNNSTSGLTADNAQSAIDELAGRAYSKAESDNAYAKKSEVYSKTETDQKITDAINTNITAALNASY